MWELYKIVMMKRAFNLPVHVNLTLIYGDEIWVMTESVAETSFL